MCRNEDSLFRESVDDYQNDGIAFGVGELLNEIHGYRIPGFFGDRKLSQIAIWSVSGCLGSGASRTGLTIILDVGSDTRPCIISVDKIQCLILSVVTRGRVVMFV